MFCRELGAEGLVIPSVCSINSDSICQNNFRRSGFVSRSQLVSDQLLTFSVENTFASGDMDVTDSQSPVKGGSAFCRLPRLEGDPCPRTYKVPAQVYQKEWTERYLGVQS